MALAPRVTASKARFVIERIEIPFLKQAAYLRLICN
jgi:hypothetical protein